MAIGNKDLKPKSKSEARRLKVQSEEEPAEVKTEEAPTEEPKKEEAPKKEAKASGKDAFSAKKSYFLPKYGKSYEAESLSEAVKMAEKDN